MFFINRKKLLICLIFIQIINCLNSENSDDYSEDESSDNSTSSYIENSSTEDYDSVSSSSVSTVSYLSADLNNTTEDYDEYEDEIEDNIEPNFIEKFRRIHSQSKNITIVTNVKHINQSFEAIRKFQKNFDYLFKTDGKSSLEFLEFLSEIDIQLSAQCSSALFRIYSSIKKTELWAMKCETKFIFYIIINIFKLGDF